MPTSDPRIAVRILPGVNHLDPPAVMRSEETQVAGYLSIHPEFDGVVCLPGTRPIAAGPYRYLRHPNYLAVAVEMAALPLVHSAWLTALVFGIGNLLLLRERVRVEERGLERAAAASPA